MTQVFSLDHMSDPETPLGWPKGWRRPNVHPMTELRAAVLESRRRAARWFTPRPEGHRAGSPIRKVAKVTQREPGLVEVELSLVSPYTFSAGPDTLTLEGGL